MEQQQPEKKHKRRVRYKGTHPRRFEEKYKELNPEKYGDTIQKVISKGSTPAGMHISICVKEILEFFDIQPGQKGLDATLGYGGHTRKMLEKLQGKGHIYALDVDPIESVKTEKRLHDAGFGEDILTIKHINFANIDQVAEEVGPFDFILADLGVSSMQIDNPERGFSYKFEGPLDLLCHLIDKNKMDIYDIKINEIADQYIEYLNQMEEMNLDIASEFIIMASTLIYLKSKSLLPKQEEAEEELTEEELIQRIIEYKKYKEIIKKLKVNYEENSKIFLGTQEQIELPKKRIEKEYDKDLIPNLYKTLLEKNEEKINKNAENIEKIAITDNYTVTSKVKEMFKAFLVKYAEIGIKGKNRYLFEDALIRQMEYVLKPVEGTFHVTKEQGRIYVLTEGDFDYEEALEALKRVFGIAYICPVVIKEDQGYEQLEKDVVAYVDHVYPDKNKSFKMHVRRAKKTYPGTSMELNADLGGAILDAFPEMKVDVHDPQLLITVEIREKIYIYSESIPGPGGMPIGTNGKAMLLLSGGIDSPVAGYMIAKRGVKIDAVYFHAPPYTSERAKQKVVDLAKLVARYSGPINLYVVNFTDIQLYIYDQCPHDELTIIMRRYMMKIAERIGKEQGCLGLITGESIGQVASQTVQSLAATNEVCTMPVFRPVIGFDKQEIVDISLKINTYETSIQPYEDCCTIFVAKHPVTKPNIQMIKKSEKKLEEKIDEMMDQAVNTAERIYIEA